MRTSHIAIRKRTLNEKQNITDEQLFASRAYAAYLTDLAEAATGRYKRHVTVRTYWDDSPEGQLAWTNNKTITINAGNSVTQSFPTRRLRADSLVGLNGHEIGHMLFTDFSMHKAYCEAFKAGRFYPNEPGCDLYDEEVALDELQQFIADKDDTAIHTILSAALNLDNILEDIYIEARMCDAFPGTFRSGILLNSIRMMELVKPLAEQAANDYMGFSIMCNLILQYCRSGDINNLTDYKGEYLDKLVKCIPVIDCAIYDDDSRVRYDASNVLVLKLWKYVKELIEKHREQKKNAADDEEAANALADLLGSQIAGGGIFPQGNTKPIKGKFKHDPNAMDEAKDTVQQVLSQDCGRIELEKTESIDEGTNTGVTHNNDYTGVGYTSSEEDMNRILNEVAEEAAMLHYEDELTEELQAEADRINYGNAHKGTHVTVNRMRDPALGLAESYMKVSPPLLLLSKRVQSKLTDLLKDKRDGGKQTNLLMGRRINPRAFAQDDGKYFYNNRLPEEKMNLAVALLVDESGSMSGSDRITYARAASIVMYDFCRKLDIPVIVYGHTSYGEDVDMFAYAEFDAIDNKDAYRMMDMSARSGNRDGAALRYVAERLMTRDEETKLLILISDGQPASSGYYGTEAEADLRGIKREYTNKGVTMFSAAIGDDKENIERIYKDGFLDITDLQLLPMNLTRLISRYIKI